MHALELEEIRWRIGLYLSSQDLVACSQVCHSWNSTFWPMQWRHITLDRTKANARTPPIRALAQHASLIRSFNFKGSLPKELVPFLLDNLQSNQMGPLVSLSFFNATIPDGKPDYWSLVVQLVTLSSSTLQELCILDSEFCVSQSLLKQLFMSRQRENDMSCKIQRRALRYLTLSLDCLIDFETWSMMLEVLRPLESVELKSIQLAYSTWQQLEPIYNSGRKKLGPSTTLDHQRPTQDQPMYPHLRWLKLEYLAGISSGACMHVLVAQCPSLRGLYWTIHKNQGFAAREFYNHLKAGAWPWLETLEIYGKPTDIPDHLLAAILHVDSTSAGKQVSFKKLCVPRSMFGSMATMALLSPTRGHTKTLRELDLFKCNQVSSRMVQDILASCPCLEVFSANSIDLEDVARGEPWVCTGLSSLTIFIRCEYSLRKRRPWWGYERCEWKTFIRLGTTRWTELEAEDHWRVFDRLSAQEKLASVKWVHKSR